MLASKRSQALFVALVAALCVGCPASSDEVQPPADEFYFPTGLALSQDDNTLFVINANSDLRFDSGTISVLDLGVVQSVVDAWDSGMIEPRFSEVVDGEPICAPDDGFPLTLICDESPLIEADRSVRIGNFATDVDVQSLDGGGSRLFIAVRGDPSVTYADMITPGGPLTCSTSEDTFHECDEDHRLVTLREREDLVSLPDEPFSIYVDDVGGFAMTTHLGNGAVTLANAPPDGAPPLLADAIGGLFADSSGTGLPSAVGLAGRSPGSDNDRVYVTSRTESRIQTLLVSRIGNELPQLLSAEFFFLNKVVPSSDSRDIAFSADGDRAYIINRDPPTLQVVDTSMTPTGVPRNEFDGAVELCRQASTLAITDTGAGERIYVACFFDGQVWAIDPVGLEVQAIISVGRGPQFLAASAARGLLFVSNFRENTIAIIDIRPASATENRVILRMGRAGETDGVE